MAKPLERGETFALWAWLVDQRRDLDARAATSAEHVIVEMAATFGDAVDTADPADAWPIWDRFVGVRRRGLLREHPSLVGLTLRDALDAGAPMGDAHAGDAGARRSRVELAARDEAIRRLHAEIEVWVSRWRGRPKRPVDMDGVVIVDGNKRAREELRILRRIDRLFGEEEGDDATERLFSAVLALVKGKPPALARRLRAQVADTRASWADVITAYVLGGDNPDVRGVARLCGRR